MRCVGNREVVMSEKVEIRIPKHVRSAYARLRMWVSGNPQLVALKVRDLMEYELPIEIEYREEPKTYLTERDRLYRTHRMKAAWTGIRVDVTIRAYGVEEGQRQDREITEIKFRGQGIFNQNWTLGTRPDNTCLWTLT